MKHVEKEKYKSCVPEKHLNIQTSKTHLTKSKIIL